jgi:hypothetical protein
MSSVEFHPELDLLHQDMAVAGCNLLVPVLFLPLVVVVGMPCFEVVGTWHHLLVEGTDCTVEVEGTDCTVEVELHNINIVVYHICIPFDNLNKIIAWSDLLLLAKRIKNRSLSCSPLLRCDVMGDLRKSHYESHVSDTALQCKSRLRDYESVTKLFSILRVIRFVEKGHNRIYRIIKYA